MTTLDRPILVTGTPRSGKSLLSELLRDDKNVVLFDEPLMTWDVGMARREDDVRSADEATEAIRNEIRGRCISALRRDGGSRYVDNLSYHALRIPFVAAVMPEAIIVHVIRPPREAIIEMLYGWTYRDSVSKAIARRASNIRLRSLPRMLTRFARNYITSRTSGKRTTWGPRVPGLRDFVKSHSPALVSAYHWMEMVRIARRDLSDLSPHQCLEVRFDRLIADPATEMRRIAERVELDADGAVLRAEAVVDPNYQFEKKVFPTDEEWREIDVLIGPLANELGYAI